MIFRNKTPTDSRNLSDLQNPQDWFLNIFNPKRTEVTEEIAIGVSEVYSSVKVLADDLAKYPLHLFQEKKGNIKKALEHPAFKLFKEKPNENMNIYDWKHLVMTQLNLWGNSYHYIQCDARGNVVGIHPLPPNETVVLLNVKTNVVSYKTVYLGEQVTFSRDEVLHFKNLSINGLVGRSPVQVLRESIQGSIQGKSMATHLFERKGLPLGLLKFTKTNLTEENKSLIKQLWNENLVDSNVAILNPEMEFTSVGIPQSDAKFIETMKYNKAEIAGIYKVPPYKYGDYSGLTHGNAATQSLDYVKNVMLPFVTNIEAELNMKVLTTLDKKRGYFFKFNLEAELRADQKSRAEFYKLMQETGALTINDILRHEDMSTIDDYGDMRFMSLNYVPLEYIKEYQLGKAGANNEKLENTSEE